MLSEASFTKIHQKPSNPKFPKSWWLTLSTHLYLYISFCPYGCSNVALIRVLLVVKLITCLVHLNICAFRISFTSGRSHKSFNSLLCSCLHFLLFLYCKYLSFLCFGISKKTENLLKRYLEAPEYGFRFTVTLSSARMDKVWERESLVCPDKIKWISEGEETIYECLSEGKLAVGYDKLFSKWTVKKNMRNSFGAGVVAATGTIRTTRIL